MNLPEGFFIRTDGERRILCEMAAVYRSVPNKHPEVKEYDTRTVAGFPKDTPRNEVREIAILDSRSRDKTLPPVEREEALHELAGRFG